MSAKTKTIAIALAIFTLVLVSIPAQIAKKTVIGVIGFEARGIDTDQVKTLEDLVTSYITEYQDFSVIANKDRQTLLKEREFALSQNDDSQQKSQGKLLSADYMLSGSVGLIDASYSFTMNLLKVETGEKRSVSELYKTMNDLVLSCRDLTDKLFNHEKAIQSSEAQVDLYVGTLTAALITGTWKTDDGINIIRLFKDGTGIATFPNGRNMKLKFEIAVNKLLIDQNEANSPYFFYYRNVSLDNAVKIAEKAQPLKWSMSLQVDKVTLKGTKSTTNVTFDSMGAILSITSPIEKAATWTRL